MKRRIRLPVSVIMCDVDGLMLINDAFGREEGDTLLKEVSSILKESCRERGYYRKGRRR